MSSNILIPVDTIAEAVVSCIWGNLQSALGLKICEQALENSPVNLGDTAEEIAAKLPAAFVLALGWDEGNSQDGPQLSLGKSELRLRITHLVQLDLAAAPGALARDVWQRAQRIAELFAKPDFSFPGNLVLPPLVQLRQVRPVSVSSFSTADLVDIGVRIGQSDVELLMQFATFGTL